MFEYPILLRWGKQPEKGFGGQLRVTPNIKQILFHFNTPSACGGELYLKDVFGFKLKNSKY